jgi:hypothetical protein
MTDDPRDPGKSYDEGYRPWTRWVVVALVVFCVLALVRIGFEADWNRW